MKLGIMQPYFFPYIEYFRMIAKCDRWIGFDTVKYNRKSWMNRNRIINRDKGWSYINVPVARSGETPTIARAEINNAEDWRRDFFGKLRVYEHSAPNYTKTIDLLQDLLAPEFATLADLNMHIIRSLCAQFEIPTTIDSLSALDLDLPESCPPGEWALNIALAVGADSYLNASGGTELFDPELYRSRGVTLGFHEHINLSYDTGPFEFVPDLSIIDPLMWIGLEQLRVAVRGSGESGKC